jgi:adenine-specific DNA methylase
MSDFPRLIEHAFPLEATSIDSVHEKNVRHGHISTLHIWPARRPLAACRAALIATLLPDPGTAEGRRELCEKIAGKVVKKIERKKMPNGQIVERVKKETEGGILHWGRETENAETLQWFRDEIRKAYGGRAPKVLDPFAGGGAIPLEAMRLGCEATAVDINPVAWFILKCTLEYPQKLAGQTRQLPDFILSNDDFMTEFFKKAKSYSKTEIRAALTKLHERLKKNKKWNDTSKLQQTFEFVNDGAEDEGELQADLAWHVRAWGQWVLERARRDLAKYYPTYADFEPLKKDSVAYEPLPMRLLEVKEDGTPDLLSLNGEFSQDYLAVKGNPRWVAKPTVGYLWARTVKCKNCRATLPLVKTLWVCKTDRRRTLLSMQCKPDRTGVEFGIIENVSSKGGNAAQRREHDRQISRGTMTKSGATCPCCKLPSMTSDDIRLESSDHRSGLQLMAVVTEGSAGKEYRAPTEIELSTIVTANEASASAVDSFEGHGLNARFSPASTRSISAQLYGVEVWGDLYSPRQRLSLAILGRHLQLLKGTDFAFSLDDLWKEAIVHSICLSLDRLLCFMCVNTRWKSDADSMTDSFSRYSISLLWDFVEANPLGTTAGGFVRCNERIATALDTLIAGFGGQLSVATVINGSAGDFKSDEKFDIILTDPPYYQAVSYADLSDFFYSWLRGFAGDGLAPFLPLSTDKINEFVQHVRSDKTRAVEKTKYERQMAEAFRRAHSCLKANGRFVCVFAHKEPDAWETLVSAIIEAGFVVTGSWPVQTEMPSRQRGAGVAALASSVWLVCKPRATTAKPGWDTKVLEEMRAKISTQLRDFWDAGIRGPDFVWAATGPAMEAYSKHPVIRKALVDGEVMSVGEFLTHVRRMVVDYVVGQVLTGSKAKETVSADRLDDVTGYYLLHRYDFRMDEAPIGACILYATACGLSDTELERTWDILVCGNASSDDDEVEESDPDEAEPDAESSSSGSKVKLKAWERRNHRSMGFEAPEGRPVPLVDRIHRVMHLWKSGDVQKVDEYLDEHGLRRNELFKRVVQSLIELSSNGERSLLESISNHIGAKGAIADRGPLLAFEFEEDE